MSMAELLGTVDGALKDPVVGISAKAALLAEENGAVRIDVAFVKWALAGTMQDTRAPNVMLRPRRWLPTGNLYDTGMRDASAQIDIGYEYFGTDAIAIQDNVVAMATALAQVIDALRQYSDDHGGTIIEVADPILFEFGQFTGPVSNGFLATITLLERSMQ